MKTETEAPMLEQRYCFHRMNRQKEGKNIAKERRVIPDPIDDRKFHGGGALIFCHRTLDPKDREKGLCG